MNDSEIIKALECHTLPSGCNDCPYVDKSAGRCSTAMAKDAFDLIKRQQAEIDRLNIEINIETVKSEAVREFAEKLKSRIRKDIDEQGMFPLPYTKKAYDTVMIFINNVAKEMTEKEGADNA